MSIETDHRAQLLADSALSAMLPDQRQFAINAIAQDVPPPYVVMTARRSIERGLDGGRLGDDISVEYQCWATSAVQAAALSDALCAAIDSLPYAVVLSLATGYDEETQRDCIVVGSQILLG